VDIRRYYHWSLMDNFEWVEGLTPRFGLVEIDYETLARRVRESGRFYAEVCARGGVDEELIERYGLG
jgi:beta-glucosidase